MSDTYKAERLRKSLSAERKRYLNSNRMWVEMFFDAKTNEPLAILWAAESEDKRLEKLATLDVLPGYYGRLQAIASMEQVLKEEEDTNAKNNDGHTTDDKE